MDDRRQPGTVEVGAQAIDAALLARARAVRLLTCDVDGVLTDGRIHVDDTGRETKAFHALDGVGFRRLAAIGVTVGWITGSGSASVGHRARMLGIAHVVLGADDKRPAWDRLRAALGVAPHECAHIGDDLPDLPFLGRCGLSVAVADAAPEVRAAADRVTTAPGGRGAVREVVEWLLTARGRWAEVVSSFKFRGDKEEP